MNEFDAKTEKLYRELDDAVAEIERNHPDALDEIQQCKAKVAEFRAFPRPKNYGEYLTLSQAQTTFKMSINFIRGQLDRNKMADSMLARRSEQFRSND